MRGTSYSNSKSGISAKFNENNGHFKVGVSMNIDNVQCYGVSSEDVNAILDMVSNATMVFSFVGVFVGFLFAWLLFGLGSAARRKNAPKKIPIDERYYMAKVLLNPAFHQAVLMHLGGRILFRVP